MRILTRVNGDIMSPEALAFIKRFFIILGLRIWVHLKNPLRSLLLIFSPNSMPFKGKNITKRLNMKCIHTRRSRFFIYLKRQRTYSPIPNISPKDTKKG